MESFYKTEKKKSSPRSSRVSLVPVWLRFSRMSLIMLSQCKSNNAAAINLKEIIIMAVSVHFPNLS